MKLKLIFSWFNRPSIEPKCFGSIKMIALSEILVIGSDLAALLAIRLVIDY